MITGKLNLQALNGAKLVEKNGQKILCIPANDNLYIGEKGAYLDIALIDTPENEYGDSHMIVKSISKERREAGEKGEILGNCKSWQNGDVNHNVPREQNDNIITDDITDDLPF